MSSDAGTLTNGSISRWMPMRSMTRIRNHGMRIVFRRIVIAAVTSSSGRRFGHGDGRRDDPEQQRLDAVEADRGEQRLLADHQIGAHQHAGRAENQQVARRHVGDTSEEPDREGEEREPERDGHELRHAEQAELGVRALDER